MAVTGEPGSGKSAVLARLVTLSDADYLRGVPEWVLAEAEARTLPPVGSIDLAVHARGLSTIEIARRVTAAAALVGTVPEVEPADEESVRELGRELGHSFSRQASAKPFRLVVDALDEARSAQQPNPDEPRRIALLLAEAAKAAGPRALRCLVGTRRRSPLLGDGVRPDLLRTLGTDPEPDDYKTTLDLDQEPYLDPPALRRYVKRLLAAHDEPNRPASATLTDDQRSRLAATITDAAGNFLVALLTALAVRDAPERTIAYPKSVGEAFDVYLSNFRARRPSVEALFRALAYAEGPGLAATDRAWALIAQAVGDGAFPDEPNLAELERFVASDGAYLVQAGSRQERQRGRVEHVPIHRIYHQAIIDHLRADQPEQRERQIFDRLHDAVPGDERQLDWKTAEPYTRRYLVRHALAGHDPDRLDTLLTQPSFCVHADPAAFEPGLLLRTHDPDALAAAYVIGRTARSPPRGGRSARACRAPRSLSSPSPTPAARSTVRRRTQRKATDRQVGRPRRPCPLALPLGRRTSRVATLHTEPTDRLGERGCAGDAGRRAGDRLRRRRGDGAGLGGRRQPAWRAAARPPRLCFRGCARDAGGRAGDRLRRRRRDGAGLGWPTAARAASRCARTTAR